MVSPDAETPELELNGAAPTSVDAGSGSECADMLRSGGMKTDHNLLQVRLVWVRLSM